MDWMPGDLSEVLSEELYGHTVQEWLIAAAVALAVFVVLEIGHGVIANRARKLTERTATIWDDVVLSAFSNTKVWFLAVVSVFVGAIVPELSTDVRGRLRTTLILATLLQVGIWLSTAFASWLEHYREERVEDHGGSVVTMNAIGMVAKIAVWSVVLLLILENLGVDVTALVAGLGVGGIAVALAVQNILGDVFSSLSIALDKPFVIGDFVIVGDLLGSVEHVGIKTTRVRSLSGEQLVFANSDLLKSRIRNYGRMAERRVVFKIGVVYGTSRQELEAIPDIIREGIEKLGQTRFDRSHFSSYGDFSLDFETVYYVLGADYNLYMDIQQAINLHIYSELGARGIEFAFPTRTIHLAPPVAQEHR